MCVNDEEFIEIIERKVQEYLDTVSEGTSFLSDMTEEDLCTVRDHLKYHMKEICIFSIDTYLGELSTSIKGLSIDPCIREQEYIFPLSEIEDGYYSSDSEIGPSPDVYTDVGGIDKYPDIELELDDPCSDDSEEVCSKCFCIKK